MAYQYGITNEIAPAWGVTTWFNLSPGKNKVDIQDFAEKIIYLYCFQSWCPGCHSHGFPTLLKVREQFSTGSDVAFVAIQTVFEGFEVNTPERAQETARQYRLTNPVGHDAGPDGQLSLVMKRYRTGGTPWTIVIDGTSVVRYNDFHADANQMTNLINQLRGTGKK
jgi:thiol-disulfide isomerase/thioredoxin